MIAYAYHALVAVFFGGFGGVIRSAWMLFAGARHCDECGDYHQRHGRYARAKIWRNRADECLAFARAARALR